MKVKEIIYMCLDLAKAATSDDSFWTEDHVLFLIKKYRSFLIKKEQEKEQSTADVASEFEYQEICLDLEKVAAIEGDPCSGYYLKSTEKIPKILDGTQPRVYPYDFYQGLNITYVPRDRMRYVGTNKYLQNIIYTSLGPDMYLYLNSTNPQFSYLKKIRMSAVFEDFDEAEKYRCPDDSVEEDDNSCDPLEATFPIREYLVPPLIELVVKELSASVYKIKDDTNNAKDDLPDTANAVAAANRYRRYGY